MNKCPNCGSTAQVRENDSFTTPDGEYINADYVCGCGCYFFDEENEQENIEKTLDKSKRV